MCSCPGALSFRAGCGITPCAARRPRLSGRHGQRRLFRRKAGLVAAVNDFLGGLGDPRAKAYMTCRAVQAAKIDFDATDDAHNRNRSEANRLAEQFFRIEASVGMD